MVTDSDFLEETLPLFDLSNLKVGEIKADTPSVSREGSVSHGP